MTMISPDCLSARALVFAKAAHGAAGHKRRYTGQDYIVHPIAVAALVSQVRHTKAMLAAALLHDVVEDAGITLSAVQEQFGPEVAGLVEWLTEAPAPANTPRRVRKELERQRRGNAPAAAQTIMLADMIDNCQSIAQLDPTFAAVYLPEKARLLEVLQEGDPELWRQAHQILHAYFGRH